MRRNHSSTEGRPPPRLPADRVASHIGSLIALSESAQASTDRQVSRVLTLVTISFAAVALITTAGSLFFTFSTLSSVRERVDSEVSAEVPAAVARRLETQLPLAVSTALATTVPEQALMAAQIQSATEFASLRPTLEARAATMVAEAVGEQVPPAASTAIAAAQTVEYAVITASASSLAEAEVAAERATAAGFRPTIFKIGQFFAVTLGPYSSGFELQAALFKARADIVESAYSIDLPASCPYSKLMPDGYYSCSFTPW